MAIHSEILTPPAAATRSFTDPVATVDYLQEIYDRNTAFLRDWFQSCAQGDPVPGRVRAYYPRVRIATATHARVDSRSSYGFVAGPGVFETTVTRPDLFRDYLIEQCALLLQHHGEPLEVGESAEPIPLHFAYPRDINVQGGFADGLPDRPLRDLFDTPDLAAMDDAIVNGTHSGDADAPQPLALFRAARVDYSLHRLDHYTGTDPCHFQNFVIFTNYPFYTDAFARHCRQQLADGTADFEAFVEPGNRITRRGENQPSGEPPERAFQMPAYHRVAADGSGVTMINIGAGPSNARNITDHVAVMRPSAWLMLGHCAGLRNTQKLGDYVLAHGYIRADHVLDEELPLWVPVPALAEMQVALEDAARQVTGLDGFELKRVIRTGTVASVDNRNWELGDHATTLKRMSQSRAVALDMESATIAANGFRFRVPYGTLLCVSDKPMHGEIKLARMASELYRQRVDQHLEMGLKALENLKHYDRERLHSRKLRSFAEVAFR
ncbi:AMP nucleosidase [Aquisalimonas asiatica]|uniref:AMP nucleosidase n=1 Tax=Aquisalimonas asiatica TaxID=406100 RepID=A0A1H8S750_9GAMM|nr:AMP nucleosidase [Aquisalimonas asiatica]SEO74356.1 AMP nucleosidase [Aquisalimonas asiatica]